jgi:hypothetical protein
VFKCFFVLVNLFCLTSLALADAKDRDVSLVVRMIKASGVMEKKSVSFMSGYLPIAILGTE